MDTACDIAIIGAGMAGASLGAALAGRAKVVVLEAEVQPGYHATGRSAAFWTESYGGPLIQPLTAASGPFLREGGFLLQRGALTVARAADMVRANDFIRQFADLGVEMHLLRRDEILALVPGLRPGWDIGVSEPSCADIDVARLHQHYLAELRKQGGTLACSAAVTRALRQSGGWRLELADGIGLDCQVVVNAAGAWADQVASLCGIRPLGITPLRRTMVQLRTCPAGPVAMPLVLDINEQFYFKPESGGVWLSPHDETPSPPCDAAPEELDVALAIARFGSVVDWQTEAVARRWAGLRSFAPDRLPVYGFDPDDGGFFWFAGQGGFGIQTAPAAAKLAAGLILGEADGELDPARYAPGRFTLS